MKTITYDDTVWKLVPLEPTQEMTDAMQSSGWLPSCYRAMLDAAPQPPVVEQQVEQEPVACLVRTRSLRTPSNIAADGKNHFCDWGEWRVESLSYGIAVTDEKRNSGPEHCYEMKPL